MRFVNALNASFTKYDYGATPLAIPLYTTGQEYTFQDDGLLVVECGGSGSGYSEYKIGEKNTSNLLIRYYSNDGTQAMIFNLPVYRGLVLKCLDSTNMYQMSSRIKLYKRM